MLNEDEVVCFIEVISALSVMKINREQLKKGFYFAVAAGLFVLFAFQLWFQAVRTSVTVDEPVHILAGQRHLQCGDFGINPEHPPLLKLLAAAPLISRTFIEPPWECGSRMTSKPESYLFGTRFLIQNDPDSVVIPFRLASAVMSLALAILVFAAAREMFGRWEALTALAILAFEPNFIAHGSLVTTDMVLTTTAFAAFYTVYRFSRKLNARRFLTAGLCAGLLLASKHSAVIFIPALFLLLLTDTFIFRRSEAPLLKRILLPTAAFAGIFLFAVVVLWSFYGFRYYAIPSAAANSISVPDYIKAMGRPEAADSLSAKIVTAVSQTRLFPESYTLGLADIVGTESRVMYLFDRAYPTGRWFYFPVSFLIKSSVALLILLLAGLAFLFFERERRRALMFLFVPALLFFAVALTSGINIGVRHILPVYPFFIVVGAAGAIWLARKFSFFRYVLIALLVYHAATAARTAPDYTAFVNDFWGGPDNAHRIFRDSNLDFGQNNKFVREYLQREGITDCWFAPQGNPELIGARLPCRILPGSFRRVNFLDEIDEPVPPVIEGAVLLNAMAFPPRGSEEYLPFMKAEPIARIGRSVFVYRGRFEVPLMAALIHAERVNQFVRLNRFEEALTDGRRAVELGPEDPRTHLALGLALARAGQKDEAGREFETVIKLARSRAVFRNAEDRARQELKRLR